MGVFPGLPPAARQALLMDPERGGFLFFDKQKKPKQQIDDGMIDEIIQQRQNEKGWKEKMYDKINIPLWLLDIIIALLIGAFFYIIIFKRNGA